MTDDPTLHAGSANRDNALLAEAETKKLPLFPVLEDYWQSLQRGGAADPEQWLRTHARTREGLPELHVLAALHETRQLILEDSHVESEDGDSTYEGGRQLLQPGTRLGECRIEGLLGCGGMGEVYLAEQEMLGRKVAIKVLPAHLARNTEAVQRFRRSLQLLARLDSHPNLAAALHAGEDQGRLYLVMEYVPGMDLRAYVRQVGRLPVAEACALMRQAAVGLAYAHGHGIVHRDIKPSNLMLTPEGTVKILDLGLARLTSPESAELASWQTQVGAILGTVDFIAPEQARNAKQADARSDLYSLGCTFYYLLRGQAPFEGRAPLETLMAHTLVAPEPLAQARPDVPPGITALVDKLLAKEPKERYPSAAAFVEALDAATGFVRTAATVGSVPRRTLGSRVRRQGTRLLAAGLLLGLLAGSLFWVSSLIPSPSLRALEWMVRRDGNDKNKTTYPLVLEGVETSSWQLSGSFARKDQRPDDFRLDGRFDRATYWYLLWFDPEGRVTVAEHSHERQAEIQCPARQDELFSITVKDPPGIHLILLVAGDRAPEETMDLLQKRLSDLGQTPQAMPQSSTFPLRPRGAQEKTRTHPSQPWSTYYQHLEARMPSGLRTVYVLPLRVVQ